MIKESSTPPAIQRSKPPRLFWAPWKIGIQLLLTFIFALVTNQCGLDIEDPTPPSPPVWVQKSLPNEWPERGIDAHESGGIFLEWEPSLQEDIVAYSVYRSIQFEELDSLGDDELIARLEVDSNMKHEYVDQQANIRVKYIYKIKCSDISNNISEFSAPQHYSLIPQLGVGSMHPNGPNAPLSDRTLKWYYSHHIEMEDYILTILTINDSLVVRKAIVPSTYVSEDESWYIPEYIYLDSAEIYQWRLDMSAEYSDRLESVGSETQWATFLYPSDEN